MSAIKRPSAWIGFYGCRGRIVRVRWTGVFRAADSRKKWPNWFIDSDGERPSQINKFDCPSCGNTHMVQFMWRKQEDLEVEVDTDLNKEYENSKGDSP